MKKIMMLLLLSYSLSLLGCQKDLEDRMNDLYDAKIPYEKEIAEKALVLSDDTAKYTLLISALYKKSADSLSYDDVRQGVARILGSCGKYSILLKALADDDHYIRIAAFVGLESRIDYIKKDTINTSIYSLNNIIDTLINDLEDSKNPDMIWELLISLGEPAANKLKNHLDIIAKVSSSIYLKSDSVLFEELLIMAFERYGDYDMADAFLHCESGTLVSIACKWAREHGYEVKYYQR